MSLGRESDRLVNSSIRRRRCRTVLGWQKIFAAASLAEPPACNHAWKVSSRIVRSSGGSSFSRPEHRRLDFRHDLGRAHRRDCKRGVVEHRDQRVCRRFSGHRQPGESQRVAGFGQFVERWTDADPGGRGLAGARRSACRGCRASRGSARWTMPTCKSGSSRHAERISRVESLFSIAGSPNFPIAGNSAATTTYGPEVGSRSRSAASQRLWRVGDPPREQRFDQRRPFFFLLENLRGQLLAVGAGHRLSEGVLRKKDACGGVQHRFGGYPAARAAARVSSHMKRNPIR